MSESIFPNPTDLGVRTDPSRYAREAQQTTQKPIWSESVTREAGRDNTNLTFEDMLLLMVTQLQNQTIDNQADTNDMMNQLIQMTVMQALTEMSTQVEDLANANVMSYAASLVGKEVTVGIIDPKTGALAEEIVGTVTATGTYNGQQVIFMGDKYYPLSSIMAVGTLPDEAVDGSTGTTPKPGETEKPDETVKPGETEKPDETVKPEEPGENTPADGGNKPVEETGGDQAPQLPVEDYPESGGDAGEKVDGTEAI